MASFEVKLPDIGEGVTEGEVVRWLVKEGDSLKHDQPMLEIMTDKATVEIPCSSEGKVTKLLAKEGQVVKVGQALLTMDGAGAGVVASMKSPGPVPSRSASASGSSSGTPSFARAEGGGSSAASGAGGHPAAGGPSAGAGQGYEVSPPAADSRVLATPSTRRYARESGVDINSLHGSGPAGRVTRDDVARAGTQTQGMGAVAAARPQVQPGQGSQAPAYQPPAYKSVIMTPQAGEERKPFRGIRKKIAENLVRAKQIIPHFTHADEADVTELVKWRQSMKAIAEQRGVKLTYLPYIMKALVATCREFPNFNASIDDAAGEMVFKHYFNVGFAADTPEGLLVPVVKNVESKPMLEIAHDISTLAEKARAGKLAPDDMKHGTITVTNIGSVGGVYATPIINHPEVAIIGVYSIQKKPVVIDDEIKIREMMNVTATCDHRIIDGAQAARFLKRFIARLENPQSLLLEMI